MARLVYAKDDKIMVSPENIPTKEDTVAVDSIEALKDYKLIYEGKDSTADARVILGSTTGIPAEGDAEIYKAAVSVEPGEEPKETPTETEKPGDEPEETPVETEEPGNEPDASVDEVEDAE